jgi:hypothetical protein
VPETQIGLIVIRLGRAFVWQPVAIGKRTAGRSSRELISRSGLLRAPGAGIDAESVRCYAASSYSWISPPSRSRRRTRSRSFAATASQAAFFVVLLSRDPRQRPLSAKTSVYRPGRQMWLAYIDETYNADRHWVIAVLVQHERVNATQRAVQAVMEEAEGRFNIADSTELHGYDLFHGENPFFPLKRAPRARIWIYERTASTTSAAIPRAFSVRSHHPADGSPS